jgi:hypothetical protein
MKWEAVLIINVEKWKNIALENYRETKENNKTTATAMIAANEIITLKISFKVLIGGWV